MNIKPDFPPHKSLESEVNEFIKSLDFFVHSSTYHDTMPCEKKNRLQRMTNPTALYIRDRADRVAFHRQVDIAFEFECKTHYPKDQVHRDMTIEMTSITHHISKSSLEVNCLYIYRHIRNRTEQELQKNPELEPELIFDCGFWISQLPEIGVIMIPTLKWSLEKVIYFEAIAKKFLPGVPIVKLKRSNGTDDPFIVIKERELRKLPDWRDLIQNLRDNHND